MNFYELYFKIFELHNYGSANISAVWQWLIQRGGKEAVPLLTECIKNK